MLEDMVTPLQLSAFDSVTLTADRVQNDDAGGSPAHSI